MFAFIGGAFGGALLTWIPIAGKQKGIRRKCVHVTKNSACKTKINLKSYMAVHSLNQTIIESEGGIHGWLLKYYQT